MPPKTKNPEVTRDNWANGEILVVSTTREGEWMQVEDPDLEVDLEDYR